MDSRDYQPIFKNTYPGTNCIKLSAKIGQNEPSVKEIYSFTDSVCRRREGVSLCASCFPTTQIKDSVSLHIWCNNKYLNHNTEKLIAVLVDNVFCCLEPVLSQSSITSVVWHYQRSARGWSFCWCWFLACLNSQAVPFSISSSWNFILKTYWKHPG